MGKLYAVGFNMTANGLCIKNRFNVFYTLLCVWFYLKFERWKKLYS